MPTEFEYTSKLLWHIVEDVRLNQSRKKARKQARKDASTAAIADRMWDFIS